MKRKQKFTDKYGWLVRRAAAVLTFAVVATSVVLASVWWMLPRFGSLSTWLADLALMEACIILDIKADKTDNAEPGRIRPVILDTAILSATLASMCLVMVFGAFGLLSIISGN
jgi:hypothetical protein